jgi:hypothetical protein
MSVRLVQQVVNSLPYAIREQVLGYARSVDFVALDIAADVGIQLTEAIRDQVALVAAVKKLYSICSASYWAVDGAGLFLQREGAESVRVGSTDYSRGGGFHLSLRRLLASFDVLLAEQGMSDIVSTGSYGEIILRLSNEQ